MEEGRVQMLFLKFIIEENDGIGGGGNPNKPQVFWKRVAEFNQVSIS